MANGSITIRLAQKDIEEIDRLIDQGYYTSRSDLIRTSVRRYLEEDRDIPPEFMKAYRIAQQRGDTTEDIVRMIREIRPKVYKEMYGDEDENDERG